ncbi:MAG TPA: hypothetical protein VGL22_17035, partial [Terracidiphilus sp.]
MLPVDLKPESFAAWPHEARALITSQLDGVRPLPLAFVPSLLRQLIDYDYSFPAERAVLERELRALATLTPAQRDQWFSAFTAISTPTPLQESDWINQPAQFVEQQAAWLWSTHQLDAFRKAAVDYGDKLAKQTQPPPPPLQRLGIAVIGKGVTQCDAPLFRNLRKQGTWFTQVSFDGALQSLLATVEQRALAHPLPFAHWYVDGGPSLPHPPGITSVSYDALAPLRGTLLKKMQSDIARPGMGPEELRTRLARITPADLDMGNAADPVLSRFQIRLFTEGSGTQIYSTTFAQWTAREILRRAQALTLLVRYAPRQRQRPMNELIAGKQSEAETDPTGSLLDGDMGAWYQWIDQQRLPGSGQAAFLAWFEGHNQAVAIGPAMPHAAESHSPLDMP